MIDNHKGVADSYTKSNFPSTFTFDKIALRNKIIKLRELHLIYESAFKHTVQKNLQKQWLFTKY